MKLSILLSFLCIIALVNQSIAQTCTSTLAEEYQALMALYQSTNGAGWTNNTGWSGGDPNIVQSVQGWHGITVDTQGHVTEIQMNGNNLVGYIPTEIGNFSFLITLYLGNNQFNGSSLPASIGNLCRLQTLHIRNAQLSGNLPSTIGDLDSIVHLFLDINQFTGSIPSAIGNLTTVQLIQLGWNQLSGSIPAEIGQLVSLKSLELDANQLSGPIPVEIGNLSNLLYLTMANNQLSGSLPSQLFSLSNLKILQLTTNQLSGTIPSQIGNLTSLQQLYLASNQFSGSIPSEIGNLLDLEYMYLQSNQFSGSLPSTIGNLTELIYFHANNNQFTGALPSTVGNLTNLIQFMVNNNDFSGTIPSTIGSLAQLQYLGLDYNELTGTIPTQMTSLGQLKYLYLSNNQLTGTIPTAIATLSNLKYLTLNQNKLTGSLPSDFWNLNQLIEVNLSYNGFSGSIPGNVPTSVATLSLRNNKLTFSNFLEAKNNFNGSSADFNYVQQDSIDVTKMLDVAAGGTLTLTTSIDRSTTPSSSYQWFKLVSGVSTPLNSPSASGHTLEIADVSLADDGREYYYTITNTSASSLTLTSRKQKLNVIVCTAPTIDFVTEELNGTHTFNPTFTGEGCTPNYTWAFGDGTTSTEQAASHSYASTGTYNVTLTIAYTCGACPAGQLTIVHEVVIENSFCGSIYCDGAGGVGIGTQVTEGFRLSVNGKIRASDIIKVYPQGQWSDFVFEKDYKLRPLSEVETFIKANGHLPEIPPAKEVEKEGIDLGGMDAKLLQKIEELTLYMIELKKENEAMKKQIDSLSKKNK